MITALEETWDGGAQLRLIVSYFNEDARSPGEGVEELKEDPFWKEKLEEGGIVEEVMTGSYSVYPQDEDESYLVIFDNYAFYWIENESVAFPVPSDATFDGVNWKLLREGKVASSSETEALEKIPDILGIHLELHEFQNSAYFDDDGKPAIGRRARHYAIVTYQNILNVITANPPIVVPFKGKLSDYSGNIPTPEQLH
ncbi:MAG: hypothetical protein IKZ87_08175 [Actinomycetaceae bacterium]|nr:hypothetical protein [Actinomycetaceae bacterium]